MPTDVKDPEKSQTDVDNDFKGIVDSSLAGLKGLGGGHDRKKAAKDEAKENKKENVGKKEQKARGRDDPLNQQHQKDKNVGHLSKLAKAVKQGGRGEKMDMAKTLAKRYAMKRFRQAILKKLATKAVMSPPGLIALGIILLILIIIIVLMGEPAVGLPEDQKLTITKTGPTEAAAGAELDYQITVAYPGSAEDITITDNLPPGTEFISADPPATCDNGECNSASRVVTWSLKAFLASESGALSNVNTTLALLLRATADNTHIVNQATGSVTPYVPPAEGGPPVEGYVPYAPPSNNCDGKYDFSKWPELNAIGNFGDPLCNFSKDNLYNHLKAHESNEEYVNIWFNVIVPGEAVGYSPNTHAPPSSGTPDAGGAWGLYQMGSSKPPPPGQPPPAPGNNGIYDRGDVNWELQTTNAIAYWKIIDCNFWSYWEAYRKAGLPNIDRC